MSFQIQLSFGFLVSESKAETTCLMAKRMKRTIFVSEATDQVHKQTTTFVYLGETVCEKADHTVDINRCVLLVNLYVPRYGLPLCDRPTAPLWLKE